MGVAQSISGGNPAMYLRNPHRRIISRPLWETARVLSAGGCQEPDPAAGEAEVTAVVDLDLDEGV